MPQDCPDLWGVWTDTERIRANLGRPILSGFREQVLAGLEAGLAEAFSPPEATADAVRRATEAAQTLGFAYMLTGDEGFGRRVKQSQYGRLPARSPSREKGCRDGRPARIPSSSEASIQGCPRRRRGANRLQHRRRHRGAWRRVMRVRAAHPLARVEVTPDAFVPVGAALDKLARFRSFADLRKQDAMKAVTTRG